MYTTPTEGAIMAENATVEQTTDSRGLPERLEEINNYAGYLPSYKVNNLVADALRREFSDDIVGEVVEKMVTADRSRKAEK